MQPEYIQFGLEDNNTPPKKRRVNPRSLQNLLRGRPKKNQPTVSSSISPATNSVITSDQRDVVDTSPQTIAPDATTLTDSNARSGITPDPGRETTVSSPVPTDRLGVGETAATLPVSTSGGTDESRESTTSHTSAASNGSTLERSLQSALADANASESNKHSTLSVIAKSGADEEDSSDSDFDFDSIQHSRIRDVSNGTETHVLNSDESTTTNAETIRASSVLEESTPHPSSSPRDQSPTNSASTSTTADDSTPEYQRYVQEQVKLLDSKYQERLALLQTPIQKYNNWFDELNKKQQEYNTKFSELQETVISSTEQHQRSLQELMESYKKRVDQFNQVKREYDALSTQRQLASLLTRSRQLP